MSLYEAISPERLRVESKPLYVPSLENVAKAIQTGLSNNFEYISFERGILLHASQ